MFLPTFPNFPISGLTIESRKKSRVDFAVTPDDPMKLGTRFVHVRVRKLKFFFFQRKAVTSERENEREREREGEGEEKKTDY